MRPISLCCCVLYPECAPCVPVFSMLFRPLRRPLPLFRSFCASPSPQVSLDQIKELRRRSGASISKCKNALVQEGGEMEKALLCLKKQGIASAAAKSFRVADEGLVASSVLPSSQENRGVKGVLVQLASETDFVARTPEFARLASLLSLSALSPSTPPSPSSLSEASLPEAVSDRITSMNAGEATLELSSVLGESISVKRVLSVEGDVVGSYTHNQVLKKEEGGGGERGGEIGLSSALVALRVSKPLLEDDERSRVVLLARQIARQVVASKPRFLSIESIPEKVKEAERETIKAALLTQISEGKMKSLPPPHFEKAVEGRLKKLWTEDVLLEQDWVSSDSDKLTVKTYVQKVGGELGVDITAFVMTGIGMEAPLEGRSEGNSST